MRVKKLSLASLARRLRPASLCTALGAALRRRRDSGGTPVEAFAWPPLEGRLLPASYAPAEWRGTLPVDSRGQLGLSFNVEGGGVLRLSLDARSARHVAESVAEYLRGHELRGRDDPAGGNTGEAFRWSRGRELSLRRPLRVVRDTPPGPPRPAGPSQTLQN